MHWSDDLAGATFDFDAIDVMGGAGANAGGSGTIWVAKTGQPVRLVVDNGEREHINEASPWVEVGPRTVSAIAGRSVTVAGASWVVDDLVGAEVRFDDQATTYRVVSNGVNVLNLDPLQAAPTANVGARVLGVRRLAGAFEVYGRARVSLADAWFTDDLLVSGATLTHPPTASSTGIYGLELNVSDLLEVAADGAIDVTGRGFAGDCSSRDASCANGGHGANNASGAGGKRYSGGSFGGLGGGPNPGATYGAPLDVFFPGSGGGYGDGGGDHGGSGGGRVWIAAGRVVLAGVVRADGGAGTNAGGGGGGGGGVRIGAGSMSGTGFVSVRGGAGATTGGGGGGGRVLVNGQALTLAVDGGLSATGTAHGAAGTATRN